MSINCNSKKDKSRNLITYNQKLFRCPVCGESMAMNAGYSFQCLSSHSFDMSKKGYLNLLTSSYTPIYSKELFEARYKICETGFYRSLIESLSNIIIQQQKKYNKKDLVILDAGCGEGSHTYELSKRMNEISKPKYIGLDISKDSINIAAKNFEDIIWCVGDLARLPFQNESLDIILNILSPANYGEFERILNQQGIIIKVVPGINYLKELRECIYEDSEERQYSNRDVINYFSKHLNLINIQNINYEYTIRKEKLPYLINMTPLTWGKSTKKFKDICEKDEISITVDLTLLVGMKKHNNTLTD